MAQKKNSHIYNRLSTLYALQTKLVQK